MSRNFDIGLDFLLWYVEERTLEKKSQKLPFKKKKSKLGPKQQIWDTHH